MRLKLSFKILLLLIGIFAVLFLSFAFVSYNSQKKNLTRAFTERATATASSLEAAIQSREEAENTQGISLNIQKSMLLDSEIESVKFYKLQGDRLVLSVSSDSAMAGQVADADNQGAFRSDTRSNSLVGFGVNEMLKVVTPVHVSGAVVGTIEVDFTLENVNAAITSSIINLLAIYLFIVALLLAVVYLVLKQIIIKPILNINRALDAVADNSFNYKLNIKSGDEFGALAGAFERMAELVRTSQESLNNRVEQQTAEIKEKADDLAKERSAILNILEDIQKKEFKAEQLAADLAKFKLAVDSVQDQVIITDPEGIVVYANAAVEKITGYSVEEAYGKKAGTLWRMPMNRQYYEHLWDVIKNQKQVFIGEIINKRKDGNLYVAQISIAPVLDKNQKLLYFVATEHDVTREKEVDKAKTEFVSLASHQLRTPLSSINWYTEMLLDGDAGPINEEQKKYLMEVSIGNRRMIDLVNALLNVSRLDLGTFMIDTAPTNIVAVTKSVVEELKPEITHKKLKVEEHYGENVPEFQADEKLLRIIIQNLLSNAVKYTNDAGSIWVDLKVVPQGGKVGSVDVVFESIALSVSDSGIGIPTEQKSKIFSKLFRADNAREAETEGTGLGLYIIKSIIDQSGGVVWFDSETGKGTTFYVTFPVSGMKKKEGTKTLDL